jgi:hypothetical protein
LTLTELVVDDTLEADVVVDMADRLTPRTAFVKVDEVVELETALELRYPDEDMIVTVVVTQLVIATWHCCTEVVFGKA